MNPAREEKIRNASDTMRAVVFAENGGVEKLQEVRLPVPEPGQGEVLVRILACGLNHLDLWIRQGLPIQIPMPHIGGCEVVGTIASLGPNTPAHLQVGQQVLVAPGLGCGSCPACHRGDDQQCADYAIIGEHAQGGFAQYIATSARRILPVSDRWSPVEWAATPLVFQTAYHMLHARGHLQTGETVLVQAAASGVGSAAIQLARQAGARVLATASNDAKLQLARDLGADVAINYRTENFAQRARAETGGRGVDLIIEHIGQDVWKDSLKCLAPGGRIVTCGASSGPQVTIDLRFFFIREIEVIGAFMGRRSELDQALFLLEKKLVRPVVDRTFPLSQLAAAQTALAERAVVGKIVITCDEVRC